MNRKLNNMKLESKLLLATIGINMLFVCVFIFAGITIVTSRYDNLLYKSMQSSSGLVAHEFSSRLDEMVTMSNMVRTDDTVQTVLDELIHPKQKYGIHFYSEIYSALQRHYLEYKEDYLKFAAISCPKFVAYTYGNRDDRLEHERIKDLEKIAVEADGSAVWVSKYARQEGLYLVREIKKIENLKLDNLGTFIVKLDFEKLIAEVSKVSKEYEDSYWMIQKDGQLVYASSALSDSDVSFVNRQIEEYGVSEINGKKYFAIRGKMQANDWEFIHMVSYEEVAKSKGITVGLYVGILGVGMLSSFALMHLVVRKITRHFDKLIERMEQFGKNTEELPIVNYDYAWRTDEIGMLHQQFERMAEQIRHLVVENYRHQLLTKEAQLKSLESQMNPHFLYNTLETINWRAKAKKEHEISQIAESLGHFLRMTLNRKSDCFSLKEEMDIIQYYMTIQQLRFDNRLNFTMDIPKQYQNAQVPKLSIQPLLENAVHYALEQITEECNISLTCVMDGEILYIYVKNSGSEFETNLLEKLRKHEIKEKGLGIALLNIEERIQLMFGEGYGLQFYNEQELAVVRMKIPYVPVKGEIAC